MKLVTPLGIKHLYHLMVKEDSVIYIILQFWLNKFKEKRLNIIYVMHLLEMLSWWRNDS